MLMTNRLITSDLFSKTLLEPAMAGATGLHIVSGYASPAMVTRHLEELKRNQVSKFSIDLLVGMTGLDGISRNSLAGFRAIPRQSVGSNFSCHFTLPGKSIHSKVYVLSDDSGPLQAFSGSANYTQVGFGLSGRSHRHFETLSEVDAAEAFNYVLEVSSNAVSYTNPDLEKYIQITTEQGNAVAAFESDLIDLVDTRELDSVVLPLIQTRHNVGQVHQRSGLNWGQRDGRNPDQAYIPIPSSIARKGFFPTRGEHFQVTTDDGEAFICTVAQDGDKALETPNDNSILGKYFRKRLNLEPGSRIERKHLDSYGSTGVEILKVDDGNFHLSFRVGISTE